jgi:hypothetical protein
MENTSWTIGYIANRFRQPNGYDLDEIRDFYFIRHCSGAKYGVVLLVKGYFGIFWQRKAGAGDAIGKGKKGRGLVTASYVFPIFFQ